MDINDDYTFYGINSYPDDNNTVITSLKNDSFQNTLIHYFYLLLGNMFMQQFFNEE